MTPARALRDGEGTRLAPPPTRLARADKVIE
jgi:hypothetical protein